ncbi:hypothetical protein V1470_00010 [Klebsiella michiganensis]|uniref:hypothetical protein n=1 Tax=Klebsiella michiganensis TaxID=1134687 RepID=UPI002E7C4E86|nr:hypothetical protein [Klebsiella michiganensis]MEE1964681.1 hypothetical protein [Klebsiella michiganensis]
MNAKPEISTGHHSYIPCLGTLTATAPSFLPLVFLPALSGFFYYQVPQESSSTCFVVKSSLTGLTLFKHTASRSLIGGGNYG